MTLYTKKIMLDLQRYPWNPDQKKELHSRFWGLTVLNSDNFYTFSWRRNTQVTIENNYSDNPENNGLGRRHHSNTKGHLMVLPDTHKITFLWNGSDYTAKLLCFMVTELFKVKTWFSKSSYCSRVFWLSL